MRRPDSLHPVVRRSLPALAATLCLLASGCTTISAVKEAGKQAAEGSVIMAAYTATVGVAVAAIVDVVTLGGIVSPEEGMGMITAVAATQAGAPVPALVPGRSIPQTGAQPTPVPRAGGQPGQTQVALAATAAPAASGERERVRWGARPDAAASHCVRIEPPRSRLGDFRLENTCSFAVKVAYCARAATFINSQCRQRTSRSPDSESSARYDHADVLLQPGQRQDLPVESHAEHLYAGACRYTPADPVTPMLTGVASITGATTVRCIGIVHRPAPPAPVAGVR